jgi:hypothetical protein
MIVRCHLEIFACFFRRKPARVLVILVVGKGKPLAEAAK